MPGVYCGVKPPPKGKARGTRKQCEEANQVRFYGVAGPRAKDIKRQQRKTKKVKRERVKTAVELREAKEEGAPGGITKPLQADLRKLKRQETEQRAILKDMKKQKKKK